jgi:hypothetical protein
LTRQVPCSWLTSNGVFYTKGRGKLLIKFFEYSNSKEFLVEPDVFEYDQNMGKPMFDLIIGCNSMEKLGIAMDFKAKTITINEIILPMRNIANLTNKSKVKEAWAISNVLAHEPTSTEQATQHAVKILFDGTLGHWRTKPVSFQLKDGVTPYHGRAFPIPKVLIMKEI